MSIRGRPTIHSSAPAGIPRHASSSTSTPLYGRSSPKNRHDRAGDLLELGRERLRRQPRQVLERPVVDHVNLARVEAERSHELPAPVLRVHDERVDGVVQPPLRARPGRGAARAGSRSWAVSTSGPRGSRRRSSHCTSSHWKWTTSASRATRR